MAPWLLPFDLFLEEARGYLRHLGIERGDLYILTHPEQREFLRRRAAKLDSMFEEGTW